MAAEKAFGVLRSLSIKALGENLCLSRRLLNEWKACVRSDWRAAPKTPVVALKHLGNSLERRCMICRIWPFRERRPNIGDIFQLVFSGQAPYQVMQLRSYRMLRSINSACLNRPSIRHGRGLWRAGLRATIDIQAMSFTTILYGPCQPTNSAGKSKSLHRL